MTYPLRPVTEDEFAAFARADMMAFGHEPEDDALPRLLELTDLTRTLAGFDDGEIISTAGAFTFDMTVPGNAIPCAGVTWVSVRPTHTRQGVLTSMMARQLSDIRDRGESIAALWASESLIYGRFGYGLASETVMAEIQKPHTAIAHAPEAPGRVRIVDRETALAAWPAAYERIRTERPGFTSRVPKWWPYRILREKSRRARGTQFLAQYEEGGEVLG